MTQLTVSVYGADLVRKGLQDLRADIPKIGRERIYNTMQSIVTKMKTYPPPPMSSTYVRTNTLGGGWMITSQSNGYRITNNTPYTKYVVGNAYGMDQAWMHAGRWKLLRDVAEGEIGKLPWSIEQHVVMAARQVGFNAIAIGASYGI